MNRERIEQCIEMMKRAKNLDMTSFQVRKVANPVCDNISDLHGCGNRACFAGYLAISDFFKEAGGYVSKIATGSPVYREIDGTLYSGSRAVAEFLDIDLDVASGIVNGKLNENDYSKFYEKSFGDVTPQDVIEKLQMILDGEL